LVNGHRRSVAVQVVSEPEICYGAGFLLRAVRESGFSSYYEFVLGADANAKTVTSNLPLLSVLAFRLDFKDEVAPNTTSPFLNYYFKVRLTGRVSLLTSARK
jgi:hypothetical protein